MSQLFLLLWLSCAAWAGLEGRAPLKHPIVLVHGATMGGPFLVIGPFHYGPYFRNVSELIQSTKTPVRIPAMPTDSSIEERAAILKNYLETEMKGQKVNIIAHSLGGLDARYLVSVLKSQQVASITTIATPHLGSPLANWAVKQMKENGFWYRFFRLIGFDMKGRRFLPELTTEFMQKKFNPKVKDVAGVRYFSVQSKASFAEGNMSYHLWFTSRWLEGEQDPISALGHDGLVPYVSQSWGEELGSLEMDHLAQMNHHEWRGKVMEKESLYLYSMIYDRLLGEGL